MIDVKHARAFICIWKLVLEIYYQNKTLRGKNFEIEHKHANFGVGGAVPP